MNGQNRHKIISKSIRYAEEILEFMFKIAGHPADIYVQIQMKHNDDGSVSSKKRTVHRQRNLQSIPSETGSFIGDKMRQL